MEHCRRGAGREEYIFGNAIQFGRKIFLNDEF